MCEAMKPAPPVIMIFFGAKSLVCSSAAFLSLLLAGGSLLVAIFKWCPVRWQTSSLQSLELGLCTDFFTDFLVQRRVKKTAVTNLRFLGVWPGGS